MTVTIEYVLSAHILEKLVEGTKIGQLGMTAHQNHHLESLSL